MAVSSGYTPGGSVAGSGCVVILTYAELQGLMAANELDLSCVYVLSDFSQGNLGAAPLFLHAVSASQIGQIAFVTPSFLVPGGEGGVFDIFAWLTGGLSSAPGIENSWSGLYDVVNNRLLSLSDNQGNVVTDYTGASISNFDWGNVNVTNCIVQNSAWTQDIGSELTYDSLYLVDATLDTAHHTAGTLMHVHILNATVTLGDETQDANATLEYTHITSGALVEVLGERALKISKCNISSGAEVLCPSSGSGAGIEDLVQESSLHSKGFIFFRSSGAANEVHQCNISGSSDIDFDGTTGGVKVYRTDLLHVSQLIFDGVVGTFLGEGEFDKNTYDNSFSNFTAIAGGTGIRTVIGNTILGGSSINIVSAAENAEFNLETNIISNGSSLACSALTTFGTAQSCRVQDSSLLTIADGGSAVGCVAEADASWNTGAFAHIASRRRGTGAFTSTGANTNRETIVTAGALN